MSSQPSTWTLLAKWGWIIVPAVAVCELALHLHQVTSVVPDSEWKQAKAEVEKMVKPDDLVAFAPRWVDPIGREMFGDKLATLEREAYPDVTRFPRAIEVSIRGEHLDDLAGWQRADKKSVGAITITTLTNPAPVTLKDDLVRHIGQPDTKVSLDGRDCNWGRSGSPRAGNLGFGPAVPRCATSAEGTPSWGSPSWRTSTIDPGAASSPPRKARRGSASTSTP